ncbi:DUF4194 domain-containing protein [Arthrobacter celericrescens]|uniref:DUF4194 domain-containing protein n=1 Tax=Arthrobacter celericrescens TaxID=2320851 RepID=UPI000EA133B7|nr:DUF4194 domain-containing protein [Arthrobacter celericrescens]
MTDSRQRNALGVDHDALAEGFGPDDIEIDDNTDTVLFDGDTGSLPLIGRKALVLLMKRTHVTSVTHPREWQAVLDHIDGIRSRLNDMFLELVIDRANEVAYKRQAGQDLGSTFSTLLANRAYVRDEVALLLHLRDVHHRAMREAEEAAYVERTDLIESLRYVRPADTRDHVRADKAAERAIDRLTEDRFLLRTDDPDRLRISPVIKTLLTVERLQAFTDAMQTADPSDPNDGGAETEEDE